jgi:ubiquinol-cytochrome c reductase cytochrome c1 subunit
MNKLLLKLILPLAACWSLALPAHAAGGSLVPWDKFPTQRTTDLPALQRGAQLFVNYCLNCHSAAFKRYNRLRDIGLTEDEIASNLIFTGAKVGETMRIAMDPREAKEWFGGVPPDLTLVARSRSALGMGTGADYLYTYLRTYYRDETKATGWNNLAYPNVGMPHVLWEKQGQQRAVFEGDRFVRLEPITAGTMTALEYDNAIADLVAFMQWMAEPNRNDRMRLGVWVLMFLGVFIVIAWRLNAAFWKDIK